MISTTIAFNMQQTFFPLSTSTIKLEGGTRRVEPPFKDPGTNKKHEFKFSKRFVFFLHKINKSSPAEFHQ